MTPRKMKCSLQMHKQMYRQTNNKQANKQQMTLTKDVHSDTASFCPQYSLRLIEEEVGGSE